MEVLVIGNPGNMLSEMYNSFLSIFKVEVVGFDRNQIAKQLVLHPIECMVVSLKDATTEQLSILEWIKTDPQYYNLKMVAVGFEYDKNKLSPSLRLVMDKVLFYPISNDDIIKEICALCGKNHLIKLKAIENQGVMNEKKVKHVLVVDDDARMLRAVKNWLQDNYKVSIVNSGLAAMAFLEKQVPDIVLLDYEMPMFSGAQTLEMMRKDKRLKDVPVFFLTGVSDKEKVKDVVLLKPQGYILKGITREQLIQKLDAFFATH